MKRRTIVKAGAALGTAALSGLAGCTGILGGDDDADDGSDDDGDADDEVSSYELAGTSAEAIAEWLVPPETLDVDPYDVDVVTPARLEPHRDELSPRLTELLDQTLFFLTGDAFEDVEWENAAVFGFANYGYGEGDLLLARGSFDPTHFRWIADGDGMDDRGEYDRFEVYADDAGAIAFDETTYVQTSRDDPVEAIERAVDAANGDERRYADDHEWFGRFVDELPDGDVVEIRDGAAGLGFHGIEGATARGDAYDVGGAETTATETIRFDAGTDVTTDLGETYLESHELRPDPEHESVDVTVDGRLLRIESTIDTSDVPSIGAW